MPETPSFLISKGKKEAAAKSLKWLRGSEYDYNQELAELQAQHEAEKANKVSLVTAFARRSTKKAIFISLGLMFFQQVNYTQCIPLQWFIVIIFKSIINDLNRLPVSMLSFSIQKTFSMQLTQELIVELQP